MLSHEGKERSFAENTILAVALSGVAGAVNATGFFAVGTYTSHVTGHLAKVGDEVAQGRMHLAREALFLILFFLAGAMVATVLVETAKRVSGRGHYTVPLLIECAVLSVVTIAAVAGGARVPFLLFVMTGMLSFAMGLQNALVTKISRAVVRTTHLTGVVTDLGIEIVRLVFWFRDRSMGSSMSGKLRHVRQSLRDPEMHKVWLHLTIILSFGGGAIAGPTIYMKYGMAAMALPCVMLLMLVAVDQAWRRFAREPPAALRAGDSSNAA